LRKGGRGVEFRFRKEGACRGKRIDSVESRDLLLRLLRFPRPKICLPLVGPFQRGKLPRNLPPPLRKKLFVGHLLNRPKGARGVRGPAQAVKEGARSRSALGIRPTRSTFGASNGPSEVFNAC
jgi:hypothetical protein